MGSETVPAAAINHKLGAPRDGGQTGDFCGDWWIGDSPLLDCEVAKADVAPWTVADRQLPPNGSTGRLCFRRCGRLGLGKSRKRTAKAGSQKARKLNARKVEVLGADRQFQAEHIG